MRFTAWLVLLATLVLWSGNWIVARAVRDDISPAVATAGRLLVVVLALGPFAWRGLVEKLPRFSARDWKIMALLGLAGGGLHLSLQWLGLHYTTATSATLYLSTAPIFILLLAAPVLGERIVARQWAGVALSFAGVALIGMQGRLVNPSFNLGDLCALASMAMWGGYTVFLRLRRDALGMVEYLMLVCLLGLGYMAPWVLAELALGATLQLSGAGAAAVLYSAFGSLLLAYAGWSYVVTRLGAARAGVTMHLMPAISVVLAAIFLGERPYWYHFAGVALILAGVALASMRARALA
ncbi:MAG: DMT family transporter [Betaproteobacteria bacterium]|nr:DMT family transporter [Betaproteobacteria bacterium]MDH5220515.1 DMT family transporter [Betaproteobacteria bacterium]MDH5351379.1 DMT family transporter [Betaproteobacteria bacterium]